MSLSFMYKNASHSTAGNLNLGTFPDIPNPHCLLRKYKTLSHSPAHFPAGGSGSVPKGSLFSWLRIPKTEERASPATYLVDFRLSIICIVHNRFTFAFPDKKLFLYYFLNHQIGFLEPYSQPLWSFILNKILIFFFAVAILLSLENHCTTTLFLNYYSWERLITKSVETLFNLNTQRNCWKIVHDKMSISILNTFWLLNQLCELYFWKLM